MPITTLWTRLTSSLDIRKLSSMYLSFLDALQRPLLWLGTSLVGIATASVILQIVLRNTSGTAPTGINAFATWLAVWAAFLLMGVLVWQDDHLKIEIIYGRLPLRTRRVLRSVQLFLYTVFGVILVLWGTYYAVEFGPNSVSIQLGVEKMWLYYSAPVGGALLSVFSIGKFIQVLTDPSRLEATYASMEGVER